MTQIISWIAMALAATAVILSLLPGGTSASVEDSVSRSELYAVRDRLDELEATVNDLASKQEVGSVSSAHRNISADVFRTPEVAQKKDSAADSDSRRQIESMNRELEALRRQVKDLESAPRGIATDSPEFKNAVDFTQRELHKERMQKHYNRVTQLKMDSMEDFVQEEGLTAAQADDLRRILSDDMVFFRDIMNVPAGDGNQLTRAERREKVASHREAVQADLKQIMTEEQTEKFIRNVMNSGMPPPPRRIEK